MSYGKDDYLTLQEYAGLSNERADQIIKKSQEAMGFVDEKEPEPIQCDLVRRKKQQGKWYDRYNAKRRKR